MGMPAMTHPHGSDPWPELEACSVLNDLVLYAPSAYPMGH